MKEAYNAIFLVIGAAIQDTVPNRLVNYFQKQQWPDVFQSTYLWIVVCWTLVVVVYAFTTWLVPRGLRKIPPIRRRIFPFARCEGLWRQKVGNERPFSIGLISYDGDRRQWDYVGFGFDENFAWKSEWRSRAIYYDEERRAWHFSGAGFLLTTRRDLPLPAQTFDIAAVMTIPKADHVNDMHAVVVDFNFLQAGRSQHRSQEDQVFPVHLTRVENNKLPIDKFTTMTPQELKEFFLGGGGRPGP